MALAVEGQGTFEKAGIPVVYSGVGKVNAAMTLAKRLAAYRHAGVGLPLVINFGSAGSRRFKTGELLACTGFRQRDMDVRGLGFPQGTTPFEDIPPALEFPHVFAGLPEGICGTGDSFETAGREHSCDVVDMEAYALAKVCWTHHAHFACAKFVSDGADIAAGTDWQANMHKASEEFLRLYRSLDEEEVRESCIC